MFISSNNLKRKKALNFLKKHAAKARGVFDYGWSTDCTCPRCNVIRSNITSKDLFVTTFEDWGGERFYNFRVLCPNCNKLSIKVSKDDIPYSVKENVLAQNTPLIEDVLLIKYNYNLLK